MTNSKEAYLGGTFEDYKAIENTDRKTNYFSREKNTYLLLKPWLFFL